MGLPSVCSLLLLARLKPKQLLLLNLVMATMVMDMAIWAMDMDMAMDIIMARDLLMLTLPLKQLLLLNLDMDTMVMDMVMVMDITDMDMVWDIMDMDTIMARDLLKQLLSLDM